MHNPGQISQIEIEANEIAEDCVCCWSLTLCCRGNCYAANSTRIVHAKTCVPPIDSSIVIV